METSSDATSATALRRSKRESTPKASEAARDAPEDASAAASGATRRSQRSAKATPAKEPPGAAVERPTSGRKTVKGVAEVDPAESEPAGRRARPPRGATAAPSTPPAASPLLGSPTKKDKLSLAEDGDAESTAALLLTPTRNRRPSRRQLEVDAPTQKAQLLMGEFSANDATALCEVVWYQIKENSYKPDVLLRDRSPARIDWHRVAERLVRSHEITLTPRACQRLWKFLAYAQDSAVGGTADGDALLSDSEPEDYELTADKINARGAMVVAQEVTVAAQEVTIGEKLVEEESLTQDSTRNPAQLEDSTTTQDTTSEDAAPESDGSAEQLVESKAPTGQTENGEPMNTSTTSDPQPATTDVVSHESDETGPRETLRTAGIQLYPQYDQPSGVPDSMQKPFDLKQQMPLVFIAEKFLRRKAVPAHDPTSENPASSSMEVDPRILAAAAMSVKLTGEKAQPKPKKKRVSDVGGEEKKPKKPRKKKEPTAATSAPRPTSVTSTAPPLAPATTKSPVPIRQAYVPSTTAPPTPTPARPALDFFSQLYQKNPGILRPNGGDEKTEVAANPSTPATAAFALDPAQIEAIYNSAPLHVRTACEQMANDDLRRFEREHLRRRLWEKARASLQNSPAPSPAAASAPIAATSSTPASSSNVVTSIPTTTTPASAAAPSLPATSEAPSTATSSSDERTTSQIPMVAPSAPVP